MSKNESTFVNRAFYDAFCGVSQWLKEHPRLDRMIVGRDTVPEGWLQFDPAKLQAEPRWVKVPGDPDGPLWPIPNLYRTAAILRVQKEEMVKARLGYEDGRDALLLRFPAGLAVGAMARMRHFSDDPTELFRKTHQDTALRTSRGPNIAVAGVYSPSEQEFVPVNTVLHEQLVIVSKVRPGIEIL